MKLLSGLVVCAALVNGDPLQAGLILESATLGDTGNVGGYTISSQLLGAKFSLTSTHRVTAIGAHLRTNVGSVWGAIVETSGTLQLPSFAPSEIESHALAHAVFSTLPTVSEDVRASVDVVLGPGDYALVIGGDGLFGTDGNGVMPDTNQINLGAEIFRGTTDPQFNYWFNSTPVAWRLVVEGEEISASAVPEPSSLALLSLGGLTLCGYRIRRRRTGAATASTAV